MLLTAPMFGHLICRVLRTFRLLPGLIPFAAAKTAFGAILLFIVIVIIVFSGLLAFAVLYNLANINILERTRELASLKVLGYYDKEVYHYISRENMISSLCGIAAGLIAGIFLCRYVVTTAVAALAAYFAAYFVTCALL